MAGFQPFPVPRRIFTSGNWLYVPKRTAMLNTYAIMASMTLISIPLVRYAILRTVPVTLMQADQPWSHELCDRRRRESSPPRHIQELIIIIDGPMLYYSYNNED